MRVLPLPLWERVGVRGKILSNSLKNCVIPPTLRPKAEMLWLTNGILDLI
jgi:hypothetical protein